MADREKVIKDLEEVREYIAQKGHDLASRKCRMMDKVTNAIALLKKQDEKIEELQDRLQYAVEVGEVLLEEQEPVEPIAIKQEMFDEFYGAVACCPKCDCMWIMYMDNDMHYCPECGQCVKWNKEVKPDA